VLGLKHENLLLRLGLVIVLVGLFAWSRYFRIDLSGETALKSGRESAPAPAVLPPDASRPAGPATNRAVRPATPPTPQVLAAVRSFGDALTPLEDRRERIRDLAAQGTDDALAILMALGNAETYLNWAAVEALGDCTNTAVEPYLLGKLDHPDPRVLAAAVVSLAKVAGERAVADIAATLARNHVRPDGHEDMVCGACVAALALTRSPAALPALEAELQHTVGTSLGYDYGSRVVAAVAGIRDPRTGPILLSYVDKLTVALTDMPSNPLGQQYVRTKIEETRQAAEAQDHQVSGNP
jgi:hypothetical protein